MSLWRFFRLSFDTFLGYPCELVVYAINDFTFTFLFKLLLVIVIIIFYQIL